jgi:hypothetical protein
MTDYDRTETCYTCKEQVYQEVAAYEDGEVYCEYCFDSEFTYCKFCNSFGHTDMGQRVGPNFKCVKCLGGRP